MFNEHILLSRSAHGDAEAFAQLYDRFIDRIYRFIFLKVPTASDAEDLTAETFLKVWNYVREGKRVAFFQALLYRTARNLVIDFYRKAGRDMESIEETELIVADRSDLTLDEKMNLKIDFERVQHSLRQLKDSYREVLVMHYLNELSIKEIARIIESSPGAVRVLLHRGVKALRQIIGDVEL